MELGLTTYEAIKRKSRRFMIPFLLIIFTVLVLIIGLWNRVLDFPSAYLQSLLFLEVMNWYDGIIIDRLWVNHSKFWVIPELKDIPYVKTWKQVLVKRRAFRCTQWHTTGRGIGVTMTDEKYKRLSLKKFDRMSIFILMGYTAVMQCK